MLMVQYLVTSRRWPPTRGTHPPQTRRYRLRVRTDNSATPFLPRESARGYCWVAPPPLRMGLGWEKQPISALSICSNCCPRFLLTCALLDGVIAFEGTDHALAPIAGATQVRKSPSLTHHCGLSPETKEHHALKANLERKTYNLPFDTIGRAASTGGAVRRDKIYSKRMGAR